MRENWNPRKTASKAENRTVCLMDGGMFDSCNGILFDFGGTLDSDGEHWLDRFYDLYEKAGLDIPRPDIKRVFYDADALCCEDPSVNAMGLRQLMNHHIRLQFSRLGIAETQTLERMVDSFCSRTEHYLQRNAGILSGWKPRYRMGVVSNFYGNLEVLCGEAGLSGSLNVMLDSIRLGVAKPDPAIFRAALDALHLPPEKVVFVGDSYERDMMPARRMGLKTVWLKGPNPRKPENAEPVDAVISHLPDLKAWMP